MTKKRFSTYFLFIAIITLCTIFVLVVQKSYENLIGPIEQAQGSNLIKPINPNLDTNTLDQIEKREELPPPELNLPLTPTTSVTPAP